ILGRLRLLGSNNVVITPLVEQKEGPVEATPTKEVKKFSPGLTYADAQAIARVIPAVDVTSAEIVLNTTITREGRHRSGKVVGVDTTYFRLTSLELAAGGWFTPLQVELGLPVAIIGDGVRARFFTTEAPLGRSLKVGNIWLTVVGVLADRRASPQAVQRLGIRDANLDVYVPVRTMLLRFRNRAQVTQRDIELASRSVTVLTADSTPDSEEQRQEQTNRNQVDRIGTHLRRAAARLRVVFAPPAGVWVGAPRGVGRRRDPPGSARLPGPAPLAGQHPPLLSPPPPQVVPCRDSPIPSMPPAVALPLVG